MSNLKRDIEELVKEKQLAHCCAGMGCETASHIDVQPIINLIESVVVEEFPSSRAEEESTQDFFYKLGWNAKNRDIKSKLIGDSNGKE